MVNMERYLKLPIFKIVSQLASEMNTQAFVIGGYVRDLILVRPSDDIDIVVLNVDWT